MNRNQTVEAEASLCGRQSHFRPEIEVATAILDGDKLVLWETSPFYLQFGFHHVP